MRTLIIAGILALAAGVTSCSSGGAAVETTMNAEAVVVDIESRPWVSSFGGLQSGNAVIVFRIARPAEYEGKTLKLGIRTLRELEVGNQRLAKGVHFSFNADAAVLRDEGVMPEVFRSQVSNIEILSEKAKPTGSGR